MNTILDYYEQEPENNTFQDVIIDVTHRCNMMCKNCYIPNRDIPDMDMDKMIETISKFPKRTMIRIIGAEPTMRSDLPEMIKRIRKTKNRCTLLTNGLRLAKDYYVKMLKQHGLTHCYLSMNGADNDDWYEKIDEMRCATKKIQALENLFNNKFIIDTGTIIVKGINDEIVERMLYVYKKLNIVNVVCRIKNIGNIGRSMYDNDSGNYSFKELVTLVSKQTGLSEDYIYRWRNKPMYKNNSPETDSFMFPMNPESEGKFIHKSGIWFKIADWKGDGKIPLRNNTRRGRLTPNWKVAPFFEHLKINEFGY